MPRLYNARRAGDCRPFPREGKPEEFVVLLANFLEEQDLLESRWLFAPLFSSNDLPSRGV